MNGLSAGALLSATCERNRKGDPTHGSEFRVSPFKLKEIGLFAPSRKAMNGTLLALP
ncbi:hypothetical protein RTCIAT899_PB00470 (plasmid) [Rhizobium tropici CIAT 899]|nr:hypothetical protein RTCIAT899_PB00470 [Rhizobium tropici CIAT 899]